VHLVDLAVCSLSVCKIYNITYIRQFGSAAIPYVL